MCTLYSCICVYICTGETLEIYTHVCTCVYTHMYVRAHGKVLLGAGIMAVGMELGENFDVYTCTVIFKFFYNQHLLLSK